MVDWATVGAYIGPLIGAMGGIAGWFAYAAKKRDVRVAQQIKDTTAPLVTNQLLMQQQIEIMNKQQLSMAEHLDKQDQTLVTVRETIARIDGRLSGLGQATSGAT